MSNGTVVPWAKLKDVPERWGAKTTVYVTDWAYEGRWTLEYVDFGAKTVTLGKRVMPWEEPTQ